MTEGLEQIKPAQWEYGRVNLTWYIRHDTWDEAAGVVRVHNNDKSILDGYKVVGTVIVINGEYEVVAFLARGDGPEDHEYKAFYAHLKKLGLKRARHVRVKGDRVVVTK